MKRSKIKAPRNKQICISVTEELLEQFKKAAAAEQVPHSYKACQLIQQYVDTHQAQIAAYDKFIASLAETSKE